MDNDDTDNENREYKIAGMINLRRLNIIKPHFVEYYYQQLLVITIGISIT